MSFPLPLTPFEEYMLCDDTPSHPMEFFYRLSFDGPLDERALAAAATAAFERHPLLAARIADRPGIRPRFEQVDGSPAISHLPVSHTDRLPPIPALEPTAGPLARLFLLSHATGAHDVLAQFHHVACDGLGALAFLADLCLLLDAAHGGTSLPAEPPDQRLLRGRGRYGLDCWKLLASLPAQARGLEGVWKFLRHRPLDLGSGPGPCEATQPRREHRLQRATADFTAAEARSLRRVATGAGLSLNELAAAALFGALLETLPQRRHLHPRDVLRLSIPMNMRRPADRRLPAANVVSMVFLDRRPAEIEFAGLASSLHDEMQLIKRLGLGLTFLLTLAVARILPGGIARLVGDRSTAASALFTNLGRIFSRAADRGTGRLQVGARRLMAVEPLAPLRRGTPLGVAAVEYGGTLSFTLRTDPDALDQDATDRLRDAFARRMRRQLPEAPRPGSVPASRLTAEACT